MVDNCTYLADKCIYLDDQVDKCTSVAGNKAGSCVKTVLLYYTFNSEQLNSL